MEMFCLRAFKAALLLLPLICSFNTFDFIVARPEVMKMVISIPFFLILILFYNGRRSLDLNSKTFFSITLFLFFAGISVLWSHNKYWYLLHIIPLLSSFLASVIIYKYIKNLEEFFWLFVISGALVSLVGMVISYFEFEIFNNLNEYGSTFGNKNAAGQFVVLTIPMALGLYIKKNKITPLIFLAISLSFLLFSQSRQIWFSLIIMSFSAIAILIKFKKFNFRKIKIIPILVFLTFTSVIGVTLSNPKYSGWKNIKNRVHLAVKQFSNPIGSSGQGSNERVSHWVNTLLMIKSAPLHGVGLGNWYIQYPKYHSTLIDDGHTYSASMKLKNLHNDHLEIFATLGLIGFVLWLYMFYGFFKLGFSIIHKDFTLILSALLSIVAYLSYSSFSFPYKLYMPLLVIFSLALIFQSYIKQTPASPLPKHNKLAVLVVLIISISLGHQRINFSHNYFKAQALSKSLKRKDVNKDIVTENMMKYAQKALNYNQMDINAAIILSSGQFHFKKNKEAYNLLKPYVNNYPYHESLLHNLGFLAFHNRDYQNTIKYWEEVLKYQKSPSYQNKIKSNLKKLKEKLNKGR
ncbi:MAG: O-antigen ligase family protein [Bacteriovoracaceae bacterium]